MDDYHAENATSTCQETIVRHSTSKEISGAALLDGLERRPEDC